MRKNDMGVFENKNYNYSLTEIKDENERKAVRKSKMEAVKEFFKVDTITELGTGSGGRTIVYQVNHYAVKLICGVTQTCNGENLNSKMTELDCLIAENLNINKNFCREMINMTILSSITDNTAGKLNIIPFTGTATRLSWKCDSFNRIGVDYAIQMPLAKCLTDEMDTYKFQKQDIPKEQPEDFTKILTVGIDLCDALIVMQMHQNKLIHQDIKPQNIFLYHDNYCLGDFGIAREEDSPQFFQEGTRNYWAPEQANGSSVDHRCDIYSLGLVLYELADTVPVHNHYKQRIDDKKLPELESDIPEGLKKVLSNACEYEPDFRYQTAEAMKKDLCRLMEDPDYVPSSTRDNYYSSRKATSQPGRSQMSSGISLPSRNIMRSGPANFQRQRQANRFLQPETAWKAGKLWYEESRRTGCRFAGLNIDKTIMPLSAVSSNAINFPINVSTDPEETVGLKPLSGVLKYPETLHNMYLIGEGGIGKTTALNSIMEDTYRDKAYHPEENGKNIIPLFVELSKAPADYCSAYHASHSTFIQRYLYMLLGSVDKQYLLSENTEEMSRIMERDDTSIMENIDQLLRADEEHTQYLLLLDGLNEVSKKQLSTKEKDFLGTPSELIVEEIKELLEKHKNITVIITSRADETLSDLDAFFERLFLTGVSEDIIKEYLDGCKISSEQVNKNSRLMETLKIPLFLKLYGELYNTADISTPGEILYSFFSERSTKYTARNRIAEIKMDRQKAGDGYETNSLDEKMQGFIFDFLLPELGWYMEKNDLYAVDLSTFKQVIDSVLKGEKETDICGIYGRKFFKEYLRGEDPAPNTQTYAKQLLNLRGPLDDNYASMIAKYCVYSLGILYANNQSYSFIHQHIRDFFAATKIITDMKMAYYINCLDNDKEKGRQCLNCLNKDLLSEDVIRFIGEILGEYKNAPDFVNGKWNIKAKNSDNIYFSDNGCVLVTSILDLFRNYFPHQGSTEYGVWNLLKIMYTARKTLAATDLKALDLRNCSLNGIELYDADLSDSLIYHETLFPSGHDGVITRALISPSGKNVFTGGRDGKLKLWHLKTAKCIKDVKKYDCPINSLSMSQNYIAVSTSSYVEILDIHTYEVKRKFNAYYGLFSPNGKYLLLLYHMKKARLVSINDGEISLIKKLSHTVRNSYIDGIPNFSKYVFSPDSNYFTLNVSFQSKRTIELWSTKNGMHITDIDESDYGNTGIAFSPDGKYLLAVDCLSYIIKLYEFDQNTGNTHLIQNVQLMSALDYEISQITCIQFVSNGQYVLIGSNYGNLFLCNFKTLLNSPQDISNNCWHLTGHDDSINSISEYVHNSTSYVLTGSSDCKVKIWNLRTKKCISLLHKGDISSTLSACYILNGKYIVISGNSRELQIFDPATGKYVDRIGTLEHYTWKETWKVSYHEKTKQLAVVLDNGSVALYRYLNGIFAHQETVKMMDTYISEFKFSPDGNKLLTLSYLGEFLCIYDIPSKKLIVLNKISRICTDTIKQTQEMPQNTTHLSIDYSFRGMGASFTPGGDTVLVSLRNADSIGYLDSYTGSFKKIDHAYYEPYRKNILHRLYKESENIAGERPMKRVVAIEYSSDGKYLYIARNGGRVELWSTFTKKCLAILKAFNAEAYNLAISSDGDYIAFSTCGPNIKIFRMSDIQKTDSFDLCFSDNIKDWKCKYNIRGAWRFEDKEFANKFYRLIYNTKEGHTQPITGMEFSPDKHQLLTTSHDKTVKIWDLTCDTEGAEGQYNMLPQCLHSIEFVPGLKVKNTVIDNLHAESTLTEHDLNMLKVYGAVFH